MTPTTTREHEATLVVGETYPGYSYHLREIGRIPVNLGGHVIKPLSLCGRPMAWDTQIPVAGFDECKLCVAQLEATRPRKDDDERVPTNHRSNRPDRSEGVR